MLKFVVWLNEGWTCRLDSCQGGVRTCGRAVDSRWW